MRAAGRNTSAVGMMEGAFFVSRTELLAWVNNLLHVNLTKVEQCASGAIYCQIIDACNPGSVAMRKVNWMAKVDHEYIPNYKILQSAFDKNEIDRHIDVDKLIRAKYQDNLEMLQFMKCYWEREGCNQSGSYDPMGPREGKSLPTWAQGTGEYSGVLTEKENVRPKAAPAKSGFAPEKRITNKVAASKPATTPRMTPRETDKALTKSTSSIPSAELVAAKGENKQLNEEMKGMRATLDGMEEERDYYFQKLRAIEIFCEERLAEGSESVAVSEIRKMLYEKENDQEDEVEQATASD